MAEQLFRDLKELEESIKQSRLLLRNAERRFKELEARILANQPTVEMPAGKCQPENASRKMPAGKCQPENASRKMPAGKYLGRTSAK